jgi:hypothetical protein
VSEAVPNRPQDALKGAGLGAATGFTFLAAEELVHFALSHTSLRGGELLTLLPFYLVIPAVFGAVLGVIGFRGVAAALWVTTATLVWLFAGIAGPSLGWLGVPMVVFGGLATIVVILFLTRARESLRWGAWAGVWAAGVLATVIDGSVLERVLSLQGALVHLGLLVICVALTLAFGKGLDRLGREPRPGVWTVLLGALLWPVVLVLPDPGASNMPQGQGASDGPPFLLVLVDGLDPSHLGAFGGPADRTPQLDSLAGRSYAFESAYLGSPVPMAAVATLYTGLLPSVHQAGPEPLLADRRTLAEHLQGAGYRTAAVFGSPDYARETGLGQGFGYYERISGLGHAPGMLASLDGLGLRLLPQRDYASADLITERVRAFIRRQGPTGWFAVAHYSTLLGQGQPLTPAGIDAELRVLDLEIQRLVQAAGPDAWVIVTSTHGLAAPGLAEDRVRAPLLIRRPRNLKPVTVLRAVSHADVLPTMLDLFGLTGRVRLDGEVLFEVTGGVPPKSEPAVLIEHGDDGAVVVAEWKLVRRGEELELFQLAGPDPGVDQAEQRPEIVEALRYELPGAERPPEAPTLDQALRDHFEQHFGEDLPAQPLGEVPAPEPGGLTAP